MPRSSVKLLLAVSAIAYGQFSFTVYCSKFAQ